MTNIRTSLRWRVLIGGAAGLAGAGVIGAALAFPSLITPSALPASSTTASTPAAASPTTPSQTVTAPASTASPSVTTSSSAPVASPPTTPTAIPSATAAPVAAGLAESAPIAVRIPSIGVDAGTVELGLEGNELETPADPDDVGWFVGAHTPGAPGRAVLAGHLTWNGRHTVFARLPELAVGALIEVDREDGTTAKFHVTAVSTFAKDDFPTAEVYAATDEPSLVLITCGGEYSAAQHYYDSNVIAFASALVE